MEDLVSLSNGLSQQDAISVIGFILCLLSSFVFSVAETAITALGSLKAKHLLDTKPDDAKELNLWLSYPARVLTTILIFNTATDILASALATEFAYRHFDDKALAISSGFTTLVVLILGEIVPKTLGNIHSERLSLPALKMVRIFYIFSYPVVRLLAMITDQMLHIFGGRKQVVSPPITEEELEFLVNVGEKAGVFEETKKDMISGVFEFDEIRVREIMTPRTDIVAIEMKQPPRDALKLALESGHSRIPVYDERIDNIVGVLIAKDLLSLALQPEKMSNLGLKHLMRKPYHVPESKLIMDVFKELKRSKNHMAIVIDEYGGTAGVITLEDMLEEIVGEIQDEHDQEPAEIVEIQPGVFDVAGLMNVEEFFEFFQIAPDMLPEEEEQKADTIAGYLIHQFGDLPTIGQLTKLANISIEVTSVLRNRIERIRVTKEPTSLPPQALD